MLSILTTLEGQSLSGAVYETDSTDLLDQGRAEGFRTFSGRSTEDLPDGFDLCGRGREGEDHETASGLGCAVFEIALPLRGDAYRVVDAVQLGEDLWVIHAFQKKSTHGIRTPKREIDLIEDRIKRLKEMLR